MNEESQAKRRVERVRHETKRRDLEVVRVDALTPNFRSITLAGESLADFVSASFDDHVKLILGADDTERVMRDYTPRKYDPVANELTLEFALHGDGPAAEWAAAAAPGHRATIGGPRGSFIVPLDYDWHLLVGDETAMPAVARRLEELPPGARAIVLLNVEPSDRRQFATHADAEIQWVNSDEALVEAVRALELPAGEGYAWCAGEASTMALLRRILVEDKGHDRHAIRAAAYWKRGAIAHHENLEG
ncbi:siderophore-interacting protein [Variovorax sp. J22R133]|uniref:siderophore-interacting protein n=1 Tax=Variovorax brevis TaxID=3053503 RepID=UPI002574B965|nr:siderophore-interacting protein [Variovorax sp. J22R133]MDM0115476.1 siderophore-interacting protein [Variovorax sp. J22R133]